MVISNIFDHLHGKFNYLDSLLRLIILVSDWGQRRMAWVEEKLFLNWMAECNLVRNT
ncbi:hypothetical protein NTGM5_610006 [Candidatus Nitrotoga sp. M5]|nr:hypothetical protein NTGM5_610006 [Candidatus Nitrotoga sp. M5]